MKGTWRILVLLLPLAMGACGEPREAALPRPFEMTADSVGHYCGMTLREHAGPKAQIILASQSWPVWFSSARDAFSFTMLAEEPKDIRAIYVSDMAKAKSWDDPGEDNWVEARRAFFVINSRRQGGMGAPETIPFSTRAAAEAFAAENGGRVVTFAEVPRAYVLGPETAPGDTTDDKRSHPG